MLFQSRSVIRMHSWNQIGITVYDLDSIILQFKCTCEQRCHLCTCKWSIGGIAFGFPLNETALL
ncbi:hypothetical protein D3C74_394570 [compost metagenome]